MYVCTNCGTEQEELYRRYSPSVLKLLKCGKCGELADKYIEYDRAIILVDLILLEKQAYRHLLYNSDVTSGSSSSYWKIIIVLWLAETIQKFARCDRANSGNSTIDRIFEYERVGDCNFYVLLTDTAFSILAFVLVVLVLTEIRWCLRHDTHRGYNVRNLTRALTVGGCGKLLGLLGIVWQHISYGLHHLLVEGYTLLCLLTAYSVACNSGKMGSLFILAIGFLAYNYASTFRSTRFFLENLDVA